jgi:hypothetical protein
LKIKLFAFYLWAHFCRFKVFLCEEFIDSSNKKKGIKLSPTLTLQPLSTHQSENFDQATYETFFAQY